MDVSVTMCLVKGHTCEREMKRQADAAVGRAGFVRVDCRQLAAILVNMSTQALSISHRNLQHSSVYSSHLLYFTPTPDLY